MSPTQQSPRNRKPLSTRRERQPLVSVVIPCLNEAANIEECVAAARAALDGAAWRAR